MDDLIILEGRSLIDKLPLPIGTSSAISRDDREVNIP